MKKIFLLLLFFTIQMLSYALNTNIVIDGITYEVKPFGTSATVISCDSEIENAVVLSTFEYNGKTYNVNKLADECFSGCSNLKSVSLPEAINVIPNKCFKNCNFTEFSLPENITEIQNEAFVNCRSLKVLTLPSSLQLVGRSCFANCDNFTSLYLYAETPPIVTPENGGWVMQFHGCLNVPSGTENVYREAYGWKDWTLILPIQGDDINNQIPAAISNLKGMGGQEGQLSATLTFDVPSCSDEGESLNCDILTIEITRTELDDNGHEIESLHIATLVVSVGEKDYTFTDNNIHRSNLYSYSVIPHIGGKAGKVNCCKFYVGVDTPGLININDIEYCKSFTRIKWNIQGKQGGYVTPESMEGITCDVWHVFGDWIVWGFYHDDKQLNTSPVTNCEFEIPLDQNGAKHDFYKIMFTQGENVIEKILCIHQNKPNQLPYILDLDDRYIDWFEINSVSTWVHQIGIKDEVTGDYDLSVYPSSADQELTLYSPRISLSGANNPVKMHIIAKKNEDVNASISFGYPDTDKEILTENISLNLADEWKEFIIPLDEYKNEEWIICYLHLDNSILLKSISIVEDDPEPIENVKLSADTPTEVYSTNGTRLNKTQRGINIIRDKEGKTIKVIK